MRKERSYAEVYNDTWGIVVNVFRVLRDPEQSARLEELLRLTPFAREEFEMCGDEQIATIADPIEAARRTIFRSFAGFGSASTNAAHATGFRANSNRHGTTPAHDWAGYPDHIASFTERLRGVVVENRPALDVIAAHDGPETLFYVDPPYPHSTRNMARGNAAYANEMDDGDHRVLAETLRSVQGMVVLSGYACPLYDEELYPDWQTVDRKTFGDGAVVRTERLWLSPATVTALNAERSPLFQEWRYD